MKPCTGASLVFPGGAEYALRTARPFLKADSGSAPRKLDSTRAARPPGRCIHRWPAGSRDQGDLGCGNCCAAARPAGCQPAAPGPRRRPRLRVAPRGREVLGELKLHGTDGSRRLALATASRRRHCRSRQTGSGYGNALRGTRNCGPHTAGARPAALLTPSELSRQHYWSRHQEIRQQTLERQRKSILVMAITSSTGSSRTFAVQGLMVPVKPMRFSIRSVQSGHGDTRVGATTYGRGATDQLRGPEAP